MSGWDVLRAKARGDHGAGLPRCSRCRRPRVLDPCRDCATPAELASRRPHPTERGETIPNYPELEERYR